jgi:hypothetical protein
MGSSFKPAKEPLFKVFPRRYPSFRGSYSNLDREAKSGMNKNIVVLIVAFVVLVGAGYYAYAKWKSLQPPPFDPRQVQQNPYMPPPPPGAPPPQR